MTPAGELLAAEIERSGAISFRRFMEIALYHPQHGYYRSRDPFGKAGDFYTAEQIQPVFGLLMAAVIRELWREAGSPAEFTIVEPGPGRREMAPAFGEWKYVPVDAGDELPTNFRGVVFANEFFDALPVDVALYTRGAFREQLVDFANGRFVWKTGNKVEDNRSEYLERYFPSPEEGRWYETNLEGLAWIERLAHALRSGWICAIDYGYTRAEAVRFPQGTLMSYRHHTAFEEVLSEPGVRDITAHVNFTALAERGAALGLLDGRIETLAQTLLRSGEAEFTRAIESVDPAEATRRRLQLKTLLFGMGETFRVLWLRKDEGKSEGKARNNEKGPENRGLE